MSNDVLKIELPKWYDLHAHFRQGDFLAPLLKDHIAMGCAGVLAMPNTAPPVAKVFESDALDYWSIEAYHKMLDDASNHALDEIIVPMYLTQDTTPAMIEEGAKSGLLRAAKYYPPHGTTGAGFSQPFTTFMENGVFAAMEQAGIVLCVHGEEHNMPAETYFGREINAEEHFYKEHLPRAIDAYPNLKIVGEHLTTKVGVDLVLQAGANVAASVTPQHLIYTIGHLLQGLKYHLYCLPLLKFEEDREALRSAVISPENTQFFAGTDSAPHTTKATECGCAAGCYTGGIAPQLYAEAFEAAGVDLATENGVERFKNFLCTIGANFYGLDIPTETFTLEKTPQTVKPLLIGADTVIPLPLGMGTSTDEITTLSWSIFS